MDSKKKFQKYLFLRTYLLRQWQLIIFLIFAFFIVSAFNYVFPYFSIYAMDTLIPQMELIKLFYFLIGILILYGFKLWIEYVLQKQILWLQENFGKELQLKLIQTISILPYSDIEARSKENFYVQFLRNVNTVKSMIDQKIIGIFKSILSIAIGFALIYHISILLFWILVVFFALVSPPIIHIQKRIRIIEKQYIENFGKFLQIILDPIRKIYHLTIWNIFDLIYQKSGERIQSLIRTHIRLQLFFKKTSNLQLIVSQIGQIIVFFASAYLLSMDRLTIGKLVGVNFYYGIISSSFIELLYLSMNWQQFTVAVEQLSNILDKKETALSTSHHSIDKIHSIEFTDVHFGYKNGHSKKVLHGIHFKIQAGEILGITGRNGSGKTTIIKLLTGLYPPDRGTITLNSRYLHSYDIRTVREKIAVCSQERYFLDGTILENILFGKEYDEAKLNRILQLCNLKELINKLSDNVHTLLDADRNILSGGYQQRLELARALYRDPDVLIIDEAFSHVDRETRRQFKEILSLFRSQGRIILFITHEIEWKSLFDKTLCL